MNLILCSYHVTYAFQSESTFYSCLNVKELFAGKRCGIWSSSDCNTTRTHKPWVRKQKLNHLAKLAKWLSLVCELICMMHFTVCSYHVTYVFQSESKLYICLKVKKLPAWNRFGIWILSDCNGTPTHKPIFLRTTMNQLAKLTEWLSYVVRTYLYCAFNCMFLSCHVRVSEWIYII